MASLVLYLGRLTDPAFATASEALAAALAWVTRAISTRRRWLRLPHMLRNHRGGKKKREDT